MEKVSQCPAVLLEGENRSGMRTKAGGGGGVNGNHL